MKILLENFRAGTGFGVFVVRMAGFSIFLSKKTEILFLLDRKSVCVRSGLIPEVFLPKDGDRKHRISHLSVEEVVARREEEEIGS